MGNDKVVMKTNMTEEITLVNGMAWQLDSAQHLTNEKSFEQREKLAADGGIGYIQ